MESSSFLTDSFEGICPDFTDLTELSDEGYCRLLRAKRYGRWHVLKTLKGDNAQLTPYRRSKSSAPPPDSFVIEKNRIPIVDL